jgi:hypothetical protein
MLAPLHNSPQYLTHQNGVENMSLFKEGGEHSIQDIGNDQYSMSISIPTDEDGRMARECPNVDCSPGYFKVTPGTGITGGQNLAYCPYCKHEAEPNDFATQEQIRYAKDLVIREAHKGVNGMIRDALGLGASGKKKLGGGFISMEISYKPGSLPHVHRPFEDEVRRDVICPHCTLDQTVFGLATWCADCGEDIFLTHVEAELAVTRLMVEDVVRRQTQLGKRVAAKDLENCLEDAVSIFEAAMKSIVRRALLVRGDTSDQIESIFKKLGNAFQNIERSQKELVSIFGHDPLSSATAEKLKLAFEKRHPITHNLGVIDRKYLERAQQAEQEGREIRVTINEIIEVLSNVLEVIAIAHKGLVKY